MKPVPCIIQIFGLDGYRTEMTDASNHHLARGWGTISVEIPGTGDCPALRQDPTSPDRLWSSLLDWMDEREELDKNRRVAWGLSTGGFYAMSIAHTHKERLTGVVSQGGGCHRMFEPEWLDKVDHLEYPFEWVSRCGILLGESIRVDSWGAIVSQSVSQKSLDMRVSKS